VTIEKLKAARPYVIVGAFVVGAVFTPPDVISQLMLAIPLWLLFELGLVLARIIGTGPTRKEADSVA
jgi:sec-independent protein translocase protein TatC